MNRRLLVLMAAAMLSFASAAWAQHVELQPFVGYRWGGSFDINQAGISSFEIKDSDSYGLTLGWLTSPSSQVDLLWSHQDTDLRVNGSLAGGGDTLSGFDIDYYQIEGSYIAGQPEETLRPFAAFGIGATHFGAPSGFSGSRTQFAFSIGGGAKLYLGKTLGLRFQVRWTPTFFNSDESVFCSSLGGCYVVAEGQFVSQVEATAGVMLRF